MLEVIVLGVIKGGIYGLIAIGLVLVFKGSRVLNFAQAEIGTASLYVAFLVSGNHPGALPYWVGALAAIAFGTGVGLVFERLIVRPMGNAPRLSVAVATVGLLTLFLALEVFIFGPSPRSLPPPIAGLGVQVAGVYVSPADMLSLAAIAILSLGLGAFLKYTDFGLAVLAASQDASAVRLMGIRLSRVSAFTWGAACGISAIAALLIEPQIGVIAPNLIGIPLLVGGIAAALLGGLTSLPGAFLGGIAVGLLEAIVKNAFIASPVANLQYVAFFVLILIVLLVRPQGLLGRVPA